MNSNDAFTALEKQARATLTSYLQYLRGPRLAAGMTLPPQQIVILVSCLVAILAYSFTVQAEVYVGMAVMANILGESGWKAGVLAIVGAGMFSSFLLSELIPYTRLLTTSAPVAEPERMETLVGQVLGLKRRSPFRQNILMVFTIFFVTVMLLVIIYFAVQGSAKTGNWPAVVLAPLLFMLDTLFGIGPFWLIVFLINRVRILLQNWRARTNYADLEENWNLVAELYGGAQTWYFREHPELEPRPELMPPVSPLAGFIITHPCHEAIEIPERIIKPQTAPATAPPPEVKPVETKAEAPQQQEAPENPADLFAAMDSDSEINDVTI